MIPWGTRTATPNHVAETLQVLREAARANDPYLIALIDQDMTVLVLAPNDGVLEKTISNMQEVAARGGRLVMIGDSRLARDFASETAATIVMPDVALDFAAMVYAVPIQLIAYHTAIVMGKDADQPRNLAKSVTVE